MKFKAVLSILTLLLISSFFTTSCTKNEKSLVPVKDTTLSQELVLHAWKSNSCFSSNLLNIVGATFTFKSDGTASYVADNTNNGSTSLDWQIDSNKTIILGKPMFPGPFLKLTVSSYNGAALNISQVSSYDPYETTTFTTASTGCNMAFTL